MQLVRQPAMRTGSWYNPISWFYNEPAEQSDIYSERLSDAAIRASAEGVCDPASPQYDADTCAMIQNQDITRPQTRADIEAQIDSLHCGTFDMMCHWGFRNVDGTWRSPMDWPLPAKIGGAVLGVAALGFAVGLVRNITGLFGGK